MREEIPRYAERVNPDQAWQQIRTELEKRKALRYGAFMDDMTGDQPIGMRQWLFVLARIYLGISFFFSDHGNARPDEIAGFLKYAMTHGYSWYARILNALVVPHTATFGTLVIVAEIYVAIALVLGLTTRLATCLALFLLINYLCAKGAAR